MFVECVQAHKISDRVHDINLLTLHGEAIGKVRWTQSYLRSAVVITYCKLTEFHSLLGKCRIVYYTARNALTFAVTLLSDLTSAKPRSGRPSMYVGRTWFFPETSRLPFPYFTGDQKVRNLASIIKYPRLSATLVLKRSKISGFLETLSLESSTAAWRVCFTLNNAGWTSLNESSINWEWWSTGAYKARRHSTWSTAAFLHQTLPVVSVSDLPLAICWSYNVIVAVGSDVWHSSWQVRWSGTCCLIISVIHRSASDLFNQHWRHSFSQCTGTRSAVEA